MCITISYIFSLILMYNLSGGETNCYRDDIKCTEKDDSRYLFYEVNAPEGFNLRRDVYMRFAILLNQMNKSKNPSLNKFKLVLPPWSLLVHWNYKEQPEKIPWGLYFDLDSLKTFAPVIEMNEFLSSYRNKYSKVVIEEVYTLQHYEDMFETGNFEERMEITKCQKKNDVTFFFYDNITSHNFHCLSYHGPATKLKELFLNTSVSTILINHAEVVLHEFFGNKLYWEARRSMRFNKELRKIAIEFRRIFLNSTDKADKTYLPGNWKDEKPGRNAIGGPYLAVHLRRRDFVRNRPKEAPPLNDVVHQIVKMLNQLHLDAVFVATDGVNQEFESISKKLSNYKILRYVPSQEVEKKFKEGGVAIIDQIICSYARYFIGTQESTFSFRIQEEREILGFPVETTFNSFCNDEDECSKPSIWQIVY